LRLPKRVQPKHDSYDLKIEWFAEAKIKSEAEKRIASMSFSNFLAKYRGQLTQFLTGGDVTAAILHFCCSAANRYIKQKYREPNQFAGFRQAEKCPGNTEGRVHVEIGQFVPAICAFGARRRVHAA
jgi:hypothetical protein